MTNIINLPITSLIFSLFVAIQEVEAATVVSFNYSSSYPIPLTDPQDYYVWDGTDLTLGCSYTNDVQLNLDASLVISRVQPDNFLRTDLVTYTLFSGGEFPNIIVCTDNWAIACPANMRQDDKFNYGENDNLTSGSLVVTLPDYNESVETGFFDCRLNTATTITFERHYLAGKCDKH